MPPSSSLSMVNEESVLVDRRFGVHSGGLPPSDSQSLTYRQQRIVEEQKQAQSHFMSSEAPSSPNPNNSASTTSRQVQFTFQSSPRSTPGVVVGVGAAPSPSRSPVPELSRLAQRRYARAVQYANFRNAHDNTANSSHSVASSVTSNSSMPGSLPPSASPKRMILTNTNTTTRPLKPPSHSASPRVLPPRIKDQSPPRVTLSPAPPQPTTPPKLPPRPPTPPRTKPPSSAGSVTSTSNTTIASTTDHSFAQSSADALEWRKHGKRVRAMLLLEDEEKGGSYFDLTNSCPIERYYRVAERVLEKFLSTSIRNNVNEMELAESYLVGNRLVKFLSIVLPTHQQYFSNDPQLQLLRKRSQEQLVHLLRYLEEIALVMDELQYNHYILRDLTPEEQTLVHGLMTPGRNGDKDPIVGGNGGGNGTSPRATTPMDVSMDSTGSAMSTQTIRTSSAPSTPVATTSSTTTPRTVSPDVMRMDRATRSPAPSTKTTTTPPKTWSDCKGSLQERITQVIQMTESFSDTYESTIEGKPEAAPHLILKRTLMAAAATEGGGGAAVKETTTTSPPNRRSSTPTPSVRQTNRMTPIQQPKQRTISPTFSENSDPSLQTLSSEESHEANHPIQHQQAQHHAQNSGWNEREEQFIWDWDENEFPADGKANNPWNQNATPNNNFKNKTNCGIPKLKQPKARPTRSERARAAAAMQYDQLFTQSQPTFKYSNGTRGLHEATYSQKQQSMEKNNNNKNVPRPPQSDAGVEESSHAIKTKIEDRLERASVIQQELRQHELRKRQNHSTSQRWRTRQSEDRTPLKVDDYGDGDNSILQDQPKEIMTNQGILRHFRGCVQCMLD